MFPPKQPPMQPGAAPQPPQQSAQPQPAAQPDAPQGGPKQVADIGFNQDVQNILLSRIQTLTPQEEKLMDSALNPQNIPVFLKILPELKPLFTMMQQGGQQGPIGQQPPAQPGQAPAPGGAPPQQQAAPAAGGAPDDEEEEESDNPLVKAPASQGLIG